MELKYTSKDIEKMINVFASIADKKDNSKELYKEMLKIIDYPIPVLQEFLNYMTALNDENQEFLKEHYRGVIGYITMRLNLVNFK
jgi:hypothetical protein